MRGLFDCPSNLLLVREKVAALQFVLVFHASYLFDSLGIQVHRWEKIPSYLQIQQQNCLGYGAACSSWSTLMSLLTLDECQMMPIDPVYSMFC